jgi:hypothetical protein
MLSSGVMAMADGVRGFAPAEFTIRIKPCIVLLTREEGPIYDFYNRKRIL